MSSKNKKSPETVDAVTGEIIEAQDVGQVPATISQRASAALAFGGMTFKTKRNVTLPLLKQGDDEPVAFRVTKAMYQSKGGGEDAKDGKPARLPPKLIQVWDFVGKREATFIVTAVLEKAFAEEYPNDSYVGKGFAIFKHPIPPGKKHKPLEIRELELDENGNLIVE